MKINFNFPFSYNKPTIFIRNQDVRAKSSSYGNCENLLSYAITTYLFCKYHVKSTCGDKIILHVDFTKYFSYEGKTIGFFFRRRYLAHKC